MRLDHRIRFERREEVEDGFGTTVAAFATQFTLAAALKPLRGGEAVLAARLEARQPAILTVRNAPQTRQITSDWRGVDDVTGTVYAIRENPRVSEDRAWLEMLVEAGVAA